MAAKIIGIVLVQNEDIFIKQVLTNIIDFCDEIKVLDNNSIDETSSIVGECVKKWDKIKIYHLSNIKKSHRFVEKYAGTDSWVFGVDGDELYDPKGLSLLRDGIKLSTYENVWRIRGMFLHVVRFDESKRIAEGYLGPPSKDPNKLWNFKMLKSWKSDDVQAFSHCQTRKFWKKNKLKVVCLFGRKGRFSSNKYISKLEGKHSFKSLNWENCFLRCLHMRMLRRSSLERKDKKLYKRLNMTDKINEPRKKENSRDKYRVGKCTKKDVSNFFYKEK